jgi:hypothetical protein
MDGCFVDLYWLPVGAGTRFQRASLAVYEALAAFVARRPRGSFVHAALKIGTGGRCYTLELMPVPARQTTPPLLMGAVGSARAGRWRLFRYQLLCSETDVLPDEEWVVGAPIRLTVDCVFAQRALTEAAHVPAYIWGRRAKGTTEMWTSDSIVSWLLCAIGIDAAAIPVPKGTRAPGWAAGIQVWTASLGSRPQ